MAERDPWEVAAPTAQRDPWEAPPSPSTVGEDVAKTMASEAAKAPLRPIGLIGDIRSGVESVRDWVGRKLGTDRLVEEAKKRLTADDLRKLKQPEGAPTTEDLARGAEKATGLEFHRPETPQGRIAGGFAAGFTDPLSLIMGPGNIARRALVGGLSGVGGEVGGEVGGPVGALIGGGLTSAATERSIAASQRAAQRRELARTAPTVGNVEQAAEAGYQRARQMDVPQSRADVSQLGANIRDDLVYGGRGFSPRNEPKTFAEVQLLEEQVALRRPGLRRKLGAGAPVGPVPSTYQNPPSSTTELMNARARLSNIRRDNPGKSEALAAGRAIEMIDAHLMTVPQVRTPLLDANANYRSAQRANDMDEAIRDALDKGGNVGDALRNGLRKVLRNDKLPKTAEEIARMEDIVRGGGIPRQLATLTGHHAYLAIWLLAHGHPVGALESIIPGLAGRGLDARRTRRAIEDLRDDILRSSPAGGGAMPNRLPQWTPGTGAASTVRAIDDALRQDNSNDPWAPQ